jgi:formate dehydrogenase
VSATTPVGQILGNQTHTMEQKKTMAKVLCVLYDDPISGYPKSYARADIPQITSYAGGQTAPTPKSIDFTPGELLGSVSGELGLRKYLESQGHTLIVTSDKEGANSVFDKELPDADIVISQPFWPAYLTAERIAKAKKLKLAITAGIGSDHVDLEAANEHGITVAEVTYSNSISVSEHAVMMILSLVRNYLPSHDWAVKGGWNTSRTALSGRMTWKECTWAQSQPAGLGWRSCAA